MNLQKILDFIKTRKEISLFIGICFLSILSLFFPAKESPQAPSSSEENFQSLDTYIPEGFSLVPIEVANYETLDSLLGPFGMVDVFTVAQGLDQKSQRVAHQVKIVRAPRNPSHFALLLPAGKVSQVLKFSGPFMVSVLNPKNPGIGLETGTEIVSRKKRSRIHYNLGD